MLLSHNSFLFFTQNDIFNKGHKNLHFSLALAIYELCNFESLNLSQFLCVSFFWY